MTRFFKGFSSLFEAFSFIFKNKMAYWYLIAAAIYGAIFLILSASIISWLTPIVTSWVDTMFPSLKLNQLVDKSWWGKFVEIMKKGATYITGILVSLFLILVVSKSAKYIVLIVLSPVLALISEIAEEKITGKSYPFDFAQLMKDVLRGILITLRNLFIELFFMTIGFFASLLFPPLAIPISIVLFFLNCYFMGFSMMDYIAERRRMGISQSVSFVRKNAWETMGLGFAFNLISFIPFLQWLVAPINGAVGAVLIVNEKDKNPV